MQASDWPKIFAIQIYEYGEKNIYEKGTVSRKYKKKP